MTVNNYYRIGASFNVLKQLQNEYPTVVSTNHHTWKICRSIHCLICNLFITEEKAVLVTGEIVVYYELIYVNYTILWPLLPMLLISKQVKRVNMHCQILTVEFSVSGVFYKGFERPGQHRLLIIIIFPRTKSIQQILFFEKTE